MWPVYFLVIVVNAMAASSETTLYKKLGDSVVLTPHSVTDPITSIAWKQGLDIAMEWYNDKVLAYRDFEGRGMLNTSTGGMTITGLTGNDSGFYTAEINNKVTDKTQLLVISAVSKPSLSVSCEPETTYCVLTCNGSTAGAEPVTYDWQSGDDVWKSTKEFKITQEEKRLWFKCNLTNPVSSSDSEKVSNPFISRDPETRKHIIVVTVVILGVFVCVGCFIFYRCRRGRGMLNISTGEMTITGLTGNDSGFYTAKINNKVPGNPVGTEQETEVMLKGVRTTSTHDTSNGTERPENILAVQETSTQDPTSTVPPETSNGTERSATSPEVPETCSQDLETPVTDERNETESSAMIPDDSKNIQPEPADE